MVSKLRGGKRTVKEVKEFINASYDENPPEKIGDFILDKNLTTSTGKVYYNPQTREAVVIHRGTQGGADWSNNLAYLSGTYERTDRYKQGKKVQDEAEKKYGAKNISTLSHSQGSVLARKLGANTKEIINLNPAYKGEQELPNEYNIRSKSDVVSGILGVKQYLNPSKNVTTIESKSSFEPLGEHSPDILDRLEVNEIGGIRNKISTNNMKRAGRLNYTGEDINWYDGGILPVSAYQNVGKTQYGVIGGGHYESESSDSDSESDEEMIGGDFFGSISKAFKPVSKAVTKTTQSIGKSLKPVTSGISKATGKLSKATDKINPLTYAFKDKGFNKLGVQSGEITQDYLLPAVVQAGKPVYDASAMTASTMLTGNPLLGKVAGDALWNTMAQPYDPRERQKSQILGEVASTAGKVLASQTKADLAEAVAKKGAKEASGKGRRGGMKKPKLLLDISFDKLSASDKKEYLKGVKEGILIPPTFPFVRQMSEREYLDNRTQYNRDKYPHLYEGVNRLDGTGRKIKGGNVPRRAITDDMIRQFVTSWNGRNKRLVYNKMMEMVYVNPELRNTLTPDELLNNAINLLNSGNEDEEPQRDFADEDRRYRVNLYRRFSQIPTISLLEAYNRRDSGLSREDGGLDIDDVEMLRLVLRERARARLGRGRRKMKGGAITDADVEWAVLQYIDEGAPNDEGVEIFDTMMEILQRYPELRNSDLTVEELLQMALQVINGTADIENLLSPPQMKGGRRKKVVL